VNKKKNGKEKERKRCKMHVGSRHYQSWCIVLSGRSQRRWHDPDEIEDSCGKRGRNTWRYSNPYSDIYGHEQNPLVIELW